VQINRHTNATENPTPATVMSVGNKNNHNTWSKNFDERPNHWSKHLKRNLDRFSRFCRAHWCAQQTDTQRQFTLHVTYVTIGHIYAVHAMQPNNWRQE